MLDPKSQGPKLSTLKYYTFKLHALGQWACQGLPTWHEQLHISRLLYLVFSLIELFFRPTVNCALPSLSFKIKADSSRLDQRKCSAHSELGTNASALRPQCLQRNTCVLLWVIDGYHVQLDVLGLQLVCQGGCKQTALVLLGLPVKIFRVLGLGFNLKPFSRSKMGHDLGGH